MIPTPQTQAASHARPDAIDRAAGLAPGTAAFAVRAHRPEFLDGAETCRLSVLAPRDDLGLPADLRLALARRVALGAANPALMAEYPMPAGAHLAALAQGDTPQDAALAALAAHADMIAQHPAAAGAADLSALQAAGYSVPQIIAVSELLAFVCFQIRVVAGLSLLKGASA